MKKIAVLLVFSILLQDLSLAFVARNITVRSEKIIPFSFSSKEQDIDKLLSIRGFLDAEIKSAYVDNGDILANIKGNYIDLELSKGTLTNGYKTVNKVDSIKLEDMQLTDETNKTIILEPDREIKSIQSVSGDFSSATIALDGNIKIKVRDLAEGIQRYDETKLEKTEFSINIDNKNLSRRVESSIVLPHKIKKVKAKSGDTSNVQNIIINDNEVTVTFDNGLPIANENIVRTGYSFFWLDRDESGNFKPYNPNAVYSTDINKITGKGKYIGEEEFDEIGLTVSDEKWKDFCGIEKDGIRYVYVFDKSKGVPKDFSGSLIDGNRISFEGQNFNSEKYTVELSNAGVYYIPEGKLYSMGELVPNTNGWGETEPNHDWESKKTFFNELTGKYETYVKHFKFFYGPREKKTFGGYYTYPYMCTFEYEHYKPITCYSGEVFYEYESQEKIDGYLYNGWIKIEYTEEKEVNDYPPTSPFNVKYNSINGNITWDPGSDDYTKTSDLKYEIEIFDGVWKNIANMQFEELIMVHKINYIEPEVRIRSIDEYNQVSDWAYSSDSQIELKGELKPYIVKPGDNIDIFANTKSLEKIKKVTAKNSELKMYLELQKINENTSNFFEVSYDVSADLLADVENYLSIKNARVAKGNKVVTDNYIFHEGEAFVDGFVTLELPETIELDRSGAVIFSSINYTDIPMDMFRYNSKIWYAGWHNSVNVLSKRTGRNIFVELESSVENIKVNNAKLVIPEYRICVNKFDYNENGVPSYEYIDVDKKYLLNPFCITWNTDAAGITSFYIYSGNELIYKYDAQWENINKHVSRIYCTEMYKEMKTFTYTGNGYANSSSAIRKKWNKIVIGVLKNYDMREFPWLGFRIRKNEYANQEYVDEYNSNIRVRNNYRLLISDDYISNNAIKRYMDILKTTNISMTRKDETVFGDDVMEYTSAFEKTNIKIPDDAKCGNYEIEVVATDNIGNVEEIKLTLVVQEDIEEGKDEFDETVEDSKDPNEEKEAKFVDKSFGRFFYKEDEGYLEELKKTDSTAGSGFICAGETLGITLITENTEYVDVNFIGDESIKTLDSLTKKFLIDIPEEKGKNTEDMRYQYVNFPKRIYPQYVDNQGMQVFKWFYTVPYGTTQTLESWSTLKNDTLEKVDITKLFDRINEPYSLEISLNGEQKNSIKLDFDVFERWDTVLNRDITEYVNNSHTRWEMRIDK